MVGRQFTEVAGNLPHGIFAMAREFSASRRGPVTGTVQKSHAVLQKSGILNAPRIPYLASQAC
jgi:hypothetical protein